MNSFVIGVLLLAALVVVVLAGDGALVLLHCWVERTAAGLAVETPASPARPPAPADAAAREVAAPAGHHTRVVETPPGSGPVAAATRPMAGARASSARPAAGSGPHPPPELAAPSAGSRHV